MLTEMIIANKVYEVFRVTEEDQVDEIAVQVLKQDCPEFLLPFHTISIDGETEFRYELLDGICMKFQSPKMYKKEFIQQMTEMLRPFRSCNDWLLDYHFLCLDPRYVFINEKEQTVRYIYLPVSGYRMSEEEIKGFFSRFVLSAELLDDKDFILKPLRLLQDGRTSLMSVLEFFQNEKGSHAPAAAPVPPRQVPPAAVPVEKSEEKQEKPAEQKKEAEKPAQESFGKVDLEGELLRNLYGEKASKNKKIKKESKKENKEKPVKEKNTGKGLLGNLFSGKKDRDVSVELSAGREEKPAKEKKNSSREIYPEYVSPVTTDVTEMDDGSEEADDGNVLRLRLESRGDYKAPSLIELNMTKGYVTVGRYDKSGAPCADFNFDHSMTFISRNHFRIEKREDGYKIIDLDSKNGTLLNEQELLSNYAYDLRSGDRIIVSKKMRLTYRVL